MRVIVKVLQGEDYVFDVKPHTQVYKLKESLYELLSIPVSQQRLLHKGRLLADDKTFCEYESIIEGTKLNLIVKQESTTKIVVKKMITPEQDVSILRGAAFKFLRDFYSESDSTRISDNFANEFLRSVSTLNLDDYERIATSCLEEERPS